MTIIKLRTAVRQR